MPLWQPVVRTIYPVGESAGQRIPVEIESEFLDRAEAIRCECDGLKATIRGAYLDYTFKEAGEYWQVGA